MLSIQDNSIHTSLCDHTADKKAQKAAHTALTRGIASTVPAASGLSEDQVSRTFSHCSCLLCSNHRGWDAAAYQTPQRSQTSQILPWLLYWLIWKPSADSTCGCLVQPQPSTRDVALSAGRPSGLQQETPAQVHSKPPGLPAPWLPEPQAQA